MPRALLYYNYRLGLESLSRADGAELVLSAATNKNKLEQGLALCEDEVCLPVKVFMGHAHSLIAEVDALFVPRIIRFERKRYACPKFLGLPDMVRSALANKVPLLSPTVEFRDSGFGLSGGWLRNCGSAGRHFKFLAALARAAKVQRQRQQALATAFAMTDGRKRVAVLGHAYNVFDDYLNLSILTKLTALGVQPVTLEHFPQEHIEEGAKSLEKDLFWHYGRQVAGAALYCLKVKTVAGVILVASFGCGPDSLITEIIARRFSNSSLPLMAITLDEHSADTGLATRIEAFVDMLDWRESL